MEIGKTLLSDGSVVSDDGTILVPASEIGRIMFKNTALRPKSLNARSNSSCSNLTAFAIGSNRDSFRFLSITLRLYSPRL